MEDVCRREKGQRKLPIFVIFGLVLFFVCAGIFSKYASAATAPSIITYQGKLLISGRLATTTQNMYFVLYDSPSAGTALYTASGTIGTPLPVSTTPSQGLFSINLGDTGTNALSQAIFQNNGSVYLEVRIGSDTLTPRKQITAVPYALNARYLDGIGVNTVSGTPYIPMSDASGNFTFNSTTITTSTITNLNILAKLGINSTSPIASLAVQGIGGTDPFAVVSSTGLSLLTILQNGYVGINTSSPVDVLAVQGGFQVVGGVTSTNLNVSTLANIKQLGINTSSPIASFALQGVNGINPFQITSSTGLSLLTILQNGYVGINTSTPYTNLSINGSLAVTGGIYDSAGTLGVNGQVLQTNGSAVVWTTMAGGGGSSSGVSTSTPNYFSVYLTPTSVTGTQLMQFSNGAITFSTNTVFSSLTATSVSSTNVTSTNLYVSNTGVFGTKLGVNTTSPIASLAVQGIGGTNPFSINSSTGDYLLTILQNGNVGIGTSSPSAKLELSDGANSTKFDIGTFGSLSITTLNAAGGINIDPQGILNLGTGANGGTDSINIGRTNANIVTTLRGYLVAQPVTDGTSAFLFKNLTGTTVFDIDTTNNRVGVGTSSPIAVLSVLASSTNAGSPIFEVASSSNASFLRVLANGNVGINSSTPIDTLAVQGGFQVVGGVTSTNLYVSGITNLGITTASSLTATNVTSTNVSSTNSYSNSYTGTWNGNLLSIAVGGTNSSTIAANGSIIYSDGTRYNASAVGVVGQILQSNGAGTPVWTSTSTMGFYSGWLLATSSADLGYSIASANPAIFAGGNSITTTRSNNTLTVSLINSGVTAGTYGSATAVPVFTVNAQGLITANSTSSIAIPTSSITSGIFGITRGGTNSSTIAANGSIIYSDGTAYNASAVGVAGQILQSNGAGTPTWINTTTMGFVNLQGATAGTQQTGNFNISGTGIVGTAFGVGTSTVSSTLTIQGSSGINPFSIVSSTGSALVTVLQNGNFGIGTSTPAQKLSVSGNISNIIDPNDTSALVQVGITSVGTSPQSIFVSGRYAYTANFSSNNISVVDISVPSAPIQIATTSVGSWPVSIFVSGRYAYTANYNSNTISVIDISNPKRPIQTATTSVGTNPNSIYVSGRYAYVTNWLSNNISVVDISNPLAPVRIANASVGVKPNSVYVSGRYAYVTNQTDATISVVDVSNPAAPIQVATTSVGAGPTSIYVSGRYAYTANYTSNSISVVDISNPLAPIQTAVFVGSDTPESIFVSGRYAYVANSGGITVVDISSSTAPTEVAYVWDGLGNRQVSIYVSGRYAYTANFNSNDISVIDISGTEVTSLIAHSAEFGNIQSRNDVFAQGNIMAGTSLMVGAGGIMSQGSLSVFASSTGATSSIFDISSAQTSNIFKVFANGNISVGTSTSQAKLTIQGAGSENPFSIVSSSASSMLTVLTNGRVGINSSSPIASLAVQGTSGTNPISIASSTGLNLFNVLQNGDVLLGDATDGAIFNMVNSVGGIEIYGQGENAFNYYADGSVYFKMDANNNSGSTVQFLNGANAALLTIGETPYFGFNTTTSDNVFTLQGVAGNTPVFNIVSSSATTLSMFTVRADGKVGINTSSPIDTLGVQGGVQVVGGVTSTNLNITGVTNLANTTITNVTSTNLNVSTLANIKQLGINTSSPIATLALQGVGGTNPFSINSSTGASLLSVLQNGSVGIGTAAPSGTLEVAGLVTLAYQQGIQSRISNDTIWNLLKVDTGTAGVLNGIANSTILGSVNGFQIGNTITGIQIANYTANSSDISFITGSAVRMRMDISGRIGINSSTPLSQFTIQGLASSTPIFDVASSTGNSVFRILANGNVGIGTSTPTEKLQVVGNISNIIGSGTSIAQVGTTTVGLGPDSIFVSGRYAYTANGNDATISVIDVSNPRAPIQIATTTVDSVPNSIFVSGRYAYTANSSNQISVIDISNPHAPMQVATATVGAGPNAIFVSGRYAYVVNNGDTTMSVVDVSNPLVPKQIALVNLGSGVNGSAIYVSGRYAYVADSTNHRLVIVDISNPSNPIIVQTLAGLGVDPSSVYVSGRYAYITNQTPSTISIIDISNPASPTIISTTTVGANPTSIFVSGRYAFTSNNGDATISIIDVSNPLLPVQVATTSVGLDATAQPVSIYVSGRYAYLAIVNQDLISIVDISGTEVTSLMAHSAEVGNLQSRNDIFAQGNIMAGTSLTVGAGGIMSNGSLTVFASTTGATSSIFDISSAQTSNIFKVFANGNIGIGTSTPTEKLSVVGNISNIIDTGTTISQISTTSVGTNPKSIFVSGRYAYVANSGDATMSVVDVSKSSAPVQIATTGVLGSSMNSVYVSGHYAYTILGSSVQIIDISNPSSPISMGNVTPGTNPKSIYVAGRYAYVANSGSNDISVIDISNPQSPVKISTTAVGSSPVSIYVSGRYAYTANSTSNTISVVDISNPYAPGQVATTSVGTNPTSIYVSGRYAYVTNFNSNTISVIDISTSSAPIQVATAAVGTGPNSIYVSGRYAYVANSSSANISVVDVSVPTASHQIVTAAVGTGPNSIYVSGRYAYVTNNVSNNISIVDISGTEVSSLIAASAEVGNLQSRNDIFAQGNIMAGTSLMVGYGGIMSQGALSVFASSTGATSSVFDISSAQTSNILRVFANGRVGVGISAPAEKLSVSGNISNIIDTNTDISQIATNTSIGAGPYSVFVSGRYAYTANSTGNSMSVIDISNPSNSVEIGRPVVGTNPYSIFVSGRYAYTANNTSNTISVVDISNPYDSVQVATTSVGTNPQSIYVSGRYAYVANNGSNSISVVDVSNPKAPIQIATTSVGTFPVSIYVSGRYAYVATNVGATGKIVVVDVSNPSNPIVMASTSVAAGAVGLKVSGRFAYVLTGAKFNIIDVSNPSAPVKVSTTSVANNTSLFVSGRYAYIATSIGMVVYDVTSSTAPSLVNTAILSVSAAQSIYVSGRYAYLVDGSNGYLYVVDISGTEVSSLMAHSAEVGNLQSRNDIFAQGNIIAGTSLVVGAGGIMSNGSLSVFASSTGVTSTIFDISSAQKANIFKVFASGTVQIGTSTAVGAVNNYRLYVDAGAAGNAGIGVNGYIKASGFISGTTTLDLAELYPLDPNCAQNGNCPQAGDVVCSVDDGHAGFYITKCESTYAENSIGIISENPGFTLGGMDPDGNSFKPVALSGRVPIKVSSVNGDIHFGDRLAASNIPGVAMKATGEGKTIAMAMGDYAGAGVGTVVSFVNVGWNNTFHQALTVDTSAKTLMVGSSTNPYNLIVTGNISLNNTSVVNKLSFATSTLFESNVSGFAGAHAFIFNAPNFSDASADSYLISLRSNNTPVFSVAANGDVHAKGNYYGASAVLGTSTNPGDLAERVDVAIDDTVEAGDVMVVDQNAPDTYRRSGSAYEQSVAGIISSNPTIIVGNGKTNYTAVMAMVGRVPVKVSNENGDIQRGDLLITASSTGYAMKYDPEKDKNNKMVAVIGVALEPSSASTSKILALIRTGWIYNRDQAIGDLQDSLQQMATAQGIDLSSSSEPGNLNIQGSNGQLTFVGGNLDLQNNSLINVATIFGKDNKWRIDGDGNLIQKITTALGDKETYGLQSSGKQEIIISGTSTLENGIRKIILTDLDQAIIDKTVPLKIQITPSGETKGVYVSERSYDSFVVKENENGQSNASFDWTVIAKILSPDQIAQQAANTDQVIPPTGGQGEQPIIPDINTTTPDVSTTTPNTPTTTPDLSTIDVVTTTAVTDVVSTTN